MSKSAGVCEHCHRSFDYSLIHNGFNDSAYAYCDACGCTAVISGWSPIPEGAPIRVHQRIDSDVEQYLDQCACGGKFTADASPRCPFCRKVLGAIEATTWIEANAPGTAKGWRWQRNWSDLYSIVVEGCVARNPWKRGIRLVGANETVTLYRPVGPEELQQIKLLNFKSRLPEQPIFYPVLTEDYAAKIASEWNVPASGSGYVTRFKIRRSFISRYQMQDAGGRQFQEYWIPASDLDELNQNIMGLIEVTKEFHRD
jgi:hypothetical protein